MGLGHASIVAPAGGGVNALCIPPDVDAWPRFANDFNDGLRLIMEEFLT